MTDETKHAIDELVRLRDHLLDKKVPATKRQTSLYEAIQTALRSLEVPKALYTAEDAVRVLLKDVCLRSDAGVADTPARVVKMLREMCRDQAFNFTTFDAEGMNEMVVQTGIPFSSLCEHHMLPFMGTASIAYIPDGKIVGLSKLARSVKHCARGLQNQERITKDTANYLAHNLGTDNVAVVLKARHMCMEVRGVSTPNVFTTTSSMRGVFMSEGSARAEFLELAR